MQSHDAFLQRDFRPLLLIGLKLSNSINLLILSDLQQLNNQLKYRAFMLSYKQLFPISRLGLNWYFTKLLIIQSCPHPTDAVTCQLIYHQSCSEIELEPYFTAVFKNVSA